MSKWVHATSISRQTKEKVYERDGGQCIFCGRPGLPEAHVIPRSRGGKGIPQNIVTVCRECHREMDGCDRVKKLELAKEYLQTLYPGWDEEFVTYHKWR